MHWALDKALLIIQSSDLTMNCKFNQLIFSNPKSKVDHDTAGAFSGRPKTAQRLMAHPADINVAGAFSKIAKSRITGYSEAAHVWT